ncbi:MAG TPA: hypothetical protein ENI87_05910 [bacterium]|nr:hypothetical protein [bacterium]
MDPSAVKVKRLVERVLACDGMIPLATLLENFAPLDGMRAAAQKLGLTPKGGFRIERAPAKVLAPLLAEQRDKDALDAIVALLLPPPAPPAAEEPANGEQDAKALAEARSLLKLRDAEVGRLRSELERAREGQGRARERAAELERQLQAAREEVARRQRALAEAAPQVPSEAARLRDDKQRERRLRELEDERDHLLARDQELRRQAARDRSRVRELEEEVAELERLIPASRRRKKKPLPPAPEPERRFLVPHLTPSFYKSLEGKERRTVERAWQAIIQFCTEGHGYPGLEVKQMAGQDTWSLRASLGLRVYFRPLPNGDIEVLELGDREDQHTTLRRLKDR